MADLTKIDVLNSKPIGNVMLADLLGRDFSKACAAGEQGEDLQVKWLRLQSGYKPNEDVYSAVHEVESDGEEEKGKKRRTKNFNMARAMGNVEIFRHKGFELNFDQVMDGLDTFIEKKEDELKEVKADLPVEDHEVAMVNGRKFEGTQEQLEHFIQLGVNDVSGTVTDDMTMVVNGVVVEKGVLAEVELIEAKLEDAEEYQETLATLVDCHGADSKEVKDFVDETAKTNPELYDEIVTAHVEIDQNLNTDPEVADSTPETEPTVAEAAPAPEQSPATTFKPDPLAL